MGVQEPKVWYPDGPLTTFLPIPTPDPTRPYGNEQCKECTDFCSGHYITPKQLINYVNNGGKMSDAMPPSHVILESFKRNNGIPNEVTVEQLSKQVLLPVEEVMMWLSHIKTVQDNRAEGAKKAAATRKRKKGNEVIKRNTEDICHACGLDEPPHDDELDIEILWIGCDTCAKWFHALCVNLTKSIPDMWHCPACLLV